MSIIFLFIFLLVNFDCHRIVIEKSLRLPRRIFPGLGFGNRGQLIIGGGGGGGGGGKLKILSVF